MFKHHYDRSFVAYVACTTPGHEGYLDCAKLVERQGQAARAADDWLIVTSFAGSEPHRFWFRCMEDEASRTTYYDIQSWSRRTGRGFNSESRHLDLSNNGYAGLYSQATAHDRLWTVMASQGDHFARIGDGLEAGQTVTAQIWTSSNQILCAYNRENVIDHWYAYVASSGGPELELELQITDIGEELLDDH